jgi:hypothetical protein
MADPNPLGTPVLFLIFNRPSLTKAVFEKIRSVRPTALYVAGDGPREHVHDDLENCELAQRAATAADWECDLRTRFQDHNLGPGPGVSTAISWFFEHVEEGIILEDDCVPSVSFFRFCEELLGHFRYEPSVMHVSGHNYQYGRRRGQASYYFSQYTHVGGWATWRRAWRHYDVQLVPANERAEIWDAAWMLSVERSKGVAVIPNANLVSNTGFGPDATHTRTTGRWAYLAAEELQFPLHHPAEISVNRRADTLTYYANFRNIPDLRLIWLYQALDFIRLLRPRLGKLIGKFRRVA